MENKEAEEYNSNKAECEKIQRTYTLIFLGFCLFCFVFNFIITN